MSLQVWLPLTQDLRNQGLASITSSGTPVFKNTGKIGNKSLDLNTRINFTCTALANVKTFSIAFWAKTNQDSNITGDWMDVLGFTDVSTGGSNGQLRWETCYTYGAPTRGVSAHDNATYATVQGPSGQASLKGNWNHFCITVDPLGSGRAIEYQDGIKIGDFAANGGHLTGNFWTGETNKVNGEIQDIRIYNHTLTQTEVKELAKGLVLHYPLNDTSLDSKPNLVPPNYWTGSKSLSLSANTTSYSFMNYPTMNVQPNKTYYWTIDVRITSGAANLTSLGIDTNCIAGGYSGNDSAHTVITVVNPNLTKIKAGEWQTAYCITTVKSDATNPQILHCLYGASSTATTVQVEYRNLMLVEASSVVPLRFWQSNIVYDCSGLCNNGTCTGTFTITNDTIRYHASTEFIKGSKINSSTGMITTSNPTFTCNFWVNTPTGTYTQYSDIVTFRGSAQFRMEVSNTTGTQLSWFNYPIGTANGIGTNGTVSNNTWNMFTITCDGTNWKTYKNGVLATTTAISGTAWTPDGTISLGDSGTLMKMSDFRIYATALSAEDILELYHTAARIDNLGNTWVYQYNEI